MHWRLIKLVRNNVQKHVPGDEPQVEYRPMTSEPEYEGALIRKLGEEVVEFICDPNEEELGDVLTVLLAIAITKFGLNPQDLMHEASKKNKRMGKFDQGIGMYVMTLDRDEFDERQESHN